MNKKFIGTWKSVDDDCSMRIEIAQSSKGATQIRAYDLMDQEEFDVLNVKVTPRTLGFDVCVPSNGYKTQNRLVLQPDGTCIYQVTITEIWINEKYE